jgi:hypothetical protein
MVVFEIQEFQNAAPRENTSEVSKTSEVYI